MIKINKITIVCPECKKTKKFNSKTKKELIKELYKMGYGIRQLQRAFGYKSPSSIQQILGRWRKK